LFRSNYFNTNASDFVYHLPEPITEVVSIQVAACEIAYMWQFISEERKNNSFVVTINNALKGKFVSGGSFFVFEPDTPKAFMSHKFTLKLPDGNYLSDNFVKTINNIFWNTVRDDSGNETNALSYIICEVSQISARTTFRANTSLEATRNSISPPAPLDAPISFDYPPNPYYSEKFSFEIDFRNTYEPTRPIYRNLGWNLGFRKEYYFVDKNNVYFSPDNKSVLYKNTNDNSNYVTNLAYLISESSYGCLHDNYIYLEIDDYHNNFASDIIVAMDNNSSYLGKNTMARIQLRSNFYTIICENGSDKTFKKREYFGPIKLEKLNIRLLDRFGKPLSLAQNDYSFLLDIKQYK
jgi:hypothetical protein